MSGKFLFAMYIMSGFYAYAALHHGLAVLRRQVNRNRILFALLCLLAMAFTLAMANAYSAKTTHELVEIRRWETWGFSFFLSLFPWFIAEYTGIRPRKLLAAMSAFWGLIVAANLILPYGIQYVDLPHITYFTLPWGETVVDLRTDRPGFWLNVAWIGILFVMAYSLYACRRLYRLGMKKRARILAGAMGSFFCFILFDVLIEWRLVEFINLNALGFAALIIPMDLEMKIESRNRNRRISAVLDHLPVAIFLKDLDGRYQLINRRFEMFFQVNDADIHGKTDFDLFPLEQAKILRANELKALATREKIQDEEVLVYNGTPHIFQVHRFPLLRQDGSPYATGGVYVDLTESRQKDEALDKLRQQVWHVDRVSSAGAIAGSLAHELAQPLSAILNNAQAGQRFLAFDKVDLDEIRDIFKDIVRDDKRAGSLINGLRSLLQKKEPPYANVNLSQCIEEAIGLLRNEIVRLDILVEHILDTNVTIRANKTQIQQVLINLMMNAMEAMSEQQIAHRILQLKARTQDNDKAWVSISDNGSGIPEEILEHVFDGFFTTKPKGLGLGLEVCRSIIEHHHGAIWAENNQGRGATFHFTLPFIPMAGTT